MPRNSSGTYTLPESAFVPSTPISSSATNSNNSDIADALTDSLSRSGDGGMQAILGLSPDGFNYVGDTDTGISRPSANTQVIYCGGTNTVQVTASGISITGTLTSSGALTVTSGGVTITAGGLTLSAGVITVPAGSVSAPPYTFASDTNTGFYRIGADNIGVAIGGTKILDISATGLTVTGNLIATSVTGTSVVATNVATQSDQEAASSTSLFVSPGRQQFHPSAAKAWAVIDSAGTVQAGYNVASTTHPGTGNYTVTFSVAMSSAFYLCVGSVLSSSGYVAVTGRAAGTVSYNTLNAAGSGTDLNHMILVFGDQ